MKAITIKGLRVNLRLENGHENHLHTLKRAKVGMSGAWFTSDRYPGIGTKSDWVQWTKENLAGNGIRV